MKKNIKKITKSNGLFIFIIILFAFLIDFFNGCGDSLSIEKNKLEDEIKLIHSQHVEIYSRLARYELIGYIEDQIKQRKLNYIRDTIHPKVIYIEKTKEK